MLAILCVICLDRSEHGAIFKWGPWMDIVSIYIIPIGATLGALSWFWIMTREDLMMRSAGAPKSRRAGVVSHRPVSLCPRAIILC